MTIESTLGIRRFDYEAQFQENSMFACLYTVYIDPSADNGKCEFSADALAWR
jgi:hypothetical protein